MSESAMYVIVGGCAIALAAGIFALGHSRGQAAARDQIFYTCVASQQNAPVAVAFHICSTITGLE
jgi:hypothetical protein